MGGLTHLYPVASFLQPPILFRLVQNARAHLQEMGAGAEKLVGSAREAGTAINAVRSSDESEALASNWGVEEVTHHACALECCHP